jgi:hypothetical protein
MHFSTKNTLNNNRNCTPKHALSQLDWVISSETLYLLIFFSWKHVNNFKVV